MIIGICGFRGTGKSETAKYLNEQYGFTRVNFKDGLVQEMKERLPDTLKAIGDMYQLTIDELFQIKPSVMRALMQNYGTEVRRQDDDAYWVNTWLRSVSELDSNVVVDDVRFHNEHEAVTSQGGILIRIKRSDITSGGQHKSETEQLEFDADFTIEVERGDIAGLHAQVDSIINTIKAD